MKSPRSPLLLIASALSLALSLALGGCGTDSPSTSGATSGAAGSWSEVQRRVRVALGAGRALDAGLLASRQQNPERFEDARRTLSRLGQDGTARALEAQAPLSNAEEDVLRGIAWDRLASQLDEPAAKARAQEKAALEYRRALKRARESDPNGQMASSNGLILNALGYFLAERGRTQGDFEQGASLARRALAKSDQSVSDARARGPRSEAFLNARFERANVRDSLAWARYKQGQATAPGRQKDALLQEAMREQEAALAEAREVLRAWDQGGLRAQPALSPELPYHLAMILRAQSSGPLDSAREAQAHGLLREAQSLDPNFAPAREALPPELPRATEPNDAPEVVPPTTSA